MQKTPDRKGRKTGRGRISTPLIVGIVVALAVLTAERDGVVAELLANAGESVAVDQAIMRFE